MARQKRIFSNVEDTINCWVLTNQPYGAFKYKGVPELTFIKDFLFMGNGVIGYKQKSTNTIFLYKNDSWHVSSSAFGMYKSGGCLRKRLTKIRRMLQAKEIQYCKVRFNGSVNGFTDKEYRDMVQRHFIATIPEQFKSCFKDGYDRDDYWRKHEFKALNNSFRDLERLNKAGRWDIPSGLSKEDESKFELDKMMYVLSGEDMSE